MADAIKFPRRIPPYMRRILARRLAAQSFPHFCQYVRPELVYEELHYLLCEAIDQLISAKIDRLMVFCPPRAGKSLFSSCLAPAYAIGQQPWDKLMGVSHSSELATDFSREVRALIQEEEYTELFGQVSLVHDAKGVRRFLIEHGRKTFPHGVYQAAGALTGIAGKGFNLGILDDPVSEQDAFSEVAQKRVINWYPAGFYSRRQPERNLIMLIATRWSTNDLPGYLINESKIGGDKFHIVDIQAELGSKGAAKLQAFSKRRAIAEAGRIIGGLVADDAVEIEVPRNKIPAVTQYEAGGSFSPIRWPMEELERTKAVMPPQHWSALYQQRPAKSRGTILLRDWWRIWPHAEPPECEHIFACYDTAFDEKDEQEAADPDYSARTTWGMFRGDHGRMALILLEWWRGKVSFPDLKAEVKRHYQFYEPDVVLIEKRATGLPLYHELRRTGIPVQRWLPPGNILSGKSKGKIPRGHASAAVLSEGLVWVMKRKWAYEVIDLCADFPYGEEDDTVDTVTMACLYTRGRAMLEAVNDMDMAQVREDYEEPDGLTEMDDSRVIN